jgi:hypothetical protein
MKKLVNFVNTRQIKINGSYYFPVEIKPQSGKGFMGKEYTEIENTAWIGDLGEIYFRVGEEIHSDIEILTEEQLQELFTKINGLIEVIKVGEKYEWFGKDPKYGSRIDFLKKHSYNSDKYIFITKGETVKTKINGSWVEVVF